MERYVERQSHLSQTSTNALPTGDASLVQNFFNEQSNRPDLFNLFNGGLWDATQRTNLLPNYKQDNQAYQTPAGQNENKGWLKMLDSLAPAPVPNMVQQMDTDPLQRLLESSSSSAAAATPSSGGTKLPLLKTLLDSDPGQPLINPMGASFAPLNSGIGRPAELPALPSAWSLSYTSPPPAAAWAPQPPPWMSPMPQPFAIPQRKF